MGSKLCWTALQHRHVPLLTMQHIMRNTWSNLCIKWKASLQGACRNMSFQMIAPAFVATLSLSLIAAHMQYALHLPV